MANLLLKNCSVFKGAGNTNHNTAFPFVSNKPFPHSSKIFFLIPHPQRLSLATKSKRRYSSSPFQNPIYDDPKILKRVEYAEGALRIFPSTLVRTLHLQCENPDVVSKSLAARTMNAKKRRWELSWAFARVVENQQQQEQKHWTKRNQGISTKSSTEKGWGEWEIDRAIKLYPHTEGRRGRGKTTAKQSADTVCQCRKLKTWMSGSLIVTCTSWNVTCEKSWTAMMENLPH